MTAKKKKMRKMKKDSSSHRDLHSKLPAISTIWIHLLRLTILHSDCASNTYLAELHVLIIDREYVPLRVLLIDHVFGKFFSSISLPLQQVQEILSSLMHSNQALKVCATPGSKHHVDGTNNE